MGIILVVLATACGCLEVLYKIEKLLEAVCLNIKGVYLFLLAEENVEF